MYVYLIQKKINASKMKDKEKYVYFLIFKKYLS